MVDEILSEKNLHFSSRSNILDVLPHWLSELIVQRKYSENTVEAYKRDVNDFINFLQNHLGDWEITIENLANLKPQDFRSWLSNRINDQKSARSNARALSSIKSLFNFLARRELLELNAISCVRRPKLAALLPKPIEENVIFNFLNLPYFFEKDQQWITNRDRALYTLLYCTGLRINEALNIKTADLSSEMNILGKGKKNRIVIVLPIALERIQVYINSCPHDLSNGYLFVSVKGKKLQASYVDNRLEKLRMMYNLPDHASAHAFRHSFATHLLNHGADLRTVQDLLGHESLSSTQIYTDIDDYNLLKIYEKAHLLED